MNAVKIVTVKLLEINNNKMQIMINPDDKIWIMNLIKEKTLKACVVSVAIALEESFLKK